MSALPHRRSSRRALTTAIAALLLLLTGALLDPASAAPQPSAQYREKPVPLTIGTVPPVPGFPVTLDGVTHLTDQNGNAEFVTAVRKQDLNDHVKLGQATLPIGSQRVKASATRLYRIGSMPQIALVLSYPVRFRFDVEHGPPLTNGSISTVTARSTVGQLVDLPAHQTNWLQGIRTVPTRTGLQARSVSWSIERVDYAGANVVNVAQQRFSPAHAGDVTVTLLFFRMDLQLRDAVFGTVHHGTVHLVYPDGRPREYALDDQGRLSLPSLPRGEYVLTMPGALPGTARPLTLSKDQQLDLPVYGWLDLLTALAVAVALVAGLGWAGRRRRRLRSASRAHGQHRWSPGRDAPRPPVVSHPHRHSGVAPGHPSTAPGHSSVVPPPSPTPVVRSEFPAG